MANAIRWLDPDGAVVSDVTYPSKSAVTDAYAKAVKQIDAGENQDTYTTVVLIVDDEETKRYDGTAKKTNTPPEKRSKAEIVKTAGNR